MNLSLDGCSGSSLPAQQSRAGSNVSVCRPRARHQRLWGTLIITVILLAAPRVFDPFCDRCQRSYRRELKIVHLGVREALLDMTLLSVKQVLLVADVPLGNVPIVVHLTRHDFDHIFVVVLDILPRVLRCMRAQVASRAGLELTSRRGEEPADRGSDSDRLQTGWQMGMVATHI